jgi:tyrosinase
MTQTFDDPLTVLARQQLLAHATTHDGAGALTFADLVFFREPQPPPRVRKNQKELSTTERARLLDAFETLNHNGLYGLFVSIHRDMGHSQHRMGSGPMGDFGAKRFLPWHRVFLYEVEKALRRIHAEVTIPYWDWSEEPATPEWLRAVRPVVEVPPPGGGPVRVTRSPGSEQELRQIVAGLDQVMQASGFPAFVDGLEAIHDRVHVWTGGTMANISTAAADPLFYMHHANVDRLWAQWQQTHAEQNPELTDDDAIMDPWRVGEKRTRETARFHYTYA